MRYALGVEYIGTQYHGFQRQLNSILPTIQAELDTAISKTADHAVSIFTAGRTDAGVHASGQVIHVDLHSTREEHKWLLGINHYLPVDISIKWIKAVSLDFHARFSAIGRVYDYKILNTRLRSALWHKRALHYYFNQLDISLMQKAANYFLGEHDFSSFRAASCQSSSPFRRIDQIKITQNHDLIIITIQANAFLHHMVRNITGILVDIGSGKKSVRYAKEILNAKDRRLSSPTAPPEGLYLTQVIYPEKFAF